MKILLLFAFSGVLCSFTFQKTVSQQSEPPQASLRETPVEGETQSVTELAVLPNSL